jgi:hypothetical protein
MLLMAPLLLAACEGAEVLSPAATATGGGESAEAPSEPEAEEDNSERIAMAETGWLTIGRDGSVFTTHFDADGTYRDYRNGEFLQSGTWRRREDGLLCFTPSAQDRLGACWETQGLEDDGTMRALDADGQAIELRRVTYLPPKAGENLADETSENAAEG